MLCGVRALHPRRVRRCVFFLSVFRPALAGRCSSVVRSLNSGVVAMPTSVARRSGRFPVRLSLNISENTFEGLDELERLTGFPRAVLARSAVDRGLDGLYRMWRARKHRLRLPSRRADGRASA